MGEQDAENPDAASTPINVDRHKTNDPNRNPETAIILPADENRDNTIMDCPETTILMRLRQFQRDHLFNLGSDLTETRGETFVRTVWWSFHEKLGDMPHEPGEKPVAKISTEKELSNAWAKVDRKNHLCRGHFLHISDNHADPTDAYKYKVDGSYILNGDRKSIRQRYPNWAYMSFLIEFKRGGTEYDPFDDTPGQDPDAAAKTRRRVRGQIMSYAERVFAYQHRTAVFLLFVNGDMFRVMRWDRAGVIVTEAVNYVRTIEGTRVLLEVTHALSKLSRAQQGLDTTAVRLLKDSCGWKRMNVLAKAFAHDLDQTERVFANVSGIHEVFLHPEKTATYGALCGDGNVAKLHRDPTHRCRSPHRTPLDTIPVFKFVRELFRKSLEAGLPRYRLMVDGREYLVGQHIFLGFGLVGRGTRGYVALEWETQRFVFLKDSWRPYLAGVEQEGAILSKLNQKNVLNVPTVIRYSDVYHTEGERAEQETETSMYHPKTGKKVVDWDIPTFSDSVEQASGSQEELEWWVSEGTETNPPKDAQERSATDSKPLKRLSSRLHASNPRQGTQGDMTVSMPGATVSFPPGPSKPADPSTSQAPGPRGVKRPADVMIAEDRRMQGGGLRHMVHTRLVVKEICLPLTAFTSSRQLVRIIFDCVNAHGTAYARCQYMHRDVSAGNLLIYPHIVVSESDGTVSIFWQGLLTDWELAKHSSKQVALQPQRTGTWHFMSAYLLSNPGLPTAIADELESFLHVLIYGAVRRVRSNMQAIHDFLQAYFAGCDVNPETDKTTCPSAKRESVVIGQSLTMSEVSIAFTGPHTPAEKHPLNSLITELLKVFHSRYVVLKWQSHSGSGSGTLQAIPATPPRGNLPPGWKAGFQAAPEFQTEEVEETEPEEPLQQPTPEMYANVAALATHKKVLNIFYTYAYSDKKVFPLDDVIPDRLNEVAPATQSQASAIDESDSTNATKPDGAANIEDSNAPKDASLEAGPSQPANASAPEHDPGKSADDLADAPKADEDDARKAEAVPTIVAPPTSRPTKRRRKDPVLKADHPAASSSTGRVTRSRSAAMLALASAAAPPAPLAPPPPPPPAASEPVPPAQASTRVTRSKSGKLPGAPGGRGGGATSNGAAPKRGTSSRSVAVARAAGGAATGRRGGPTTRSTQVETRGRRSRRS